MTTGFHFTHVKGARTMQKKHRQNKFKKSIDLYRCPLCKKALLMNDSGSLVCENHHCFDISSKGYVNFLTKQIDAKYNKELFESRRAVFDDAFYENISSSIIDIILKHSALKKRICVLDVGCGEGYYALKLSERFGDMAVVAALDLSKDAVMIAARGGNDVNWVIADLTNIPLKDNSANVILNIFTPASYTEFMRLLTDGGIVIKAVPGEKYLCELREKALNQLKNKEYSNKQVADYFEEYFNVIERIHISNTFPVTKDQLNNFIKMTPMMFGVNVDELNTDDIKSMTIDVEIIVGSKKH